MTVSLPLVSLVPSIRGDRRSFLLPFTTWVQILDGDDAAREFFDGHYSRYVYADGRKPKLFVGPGFKMVLTTPCRRALFVWRKFISGDGEQGVSCAVFRNEGGGSIVRPDPRRRHSRGRALARRAPLHLRQRGENGEPARPRLSAGQMLHRGGVARYRTPDEAQRPSHPRTARAVSALIYHGTPITPRAALDQLGGRAFCVSFYRPDCVDQVEALSPAVMYDNGAFSFFTRANRLGIPKEDRGGWLDYYEWLDARLFHPGRWAVIPDEIDAGSQLQDALLADWPFGHRGAPVWHTDEPLHRLLRLMDAWPRVCIGSTGEHWRVGGEAWRARMDEAWNEIWRRHRRPALHMLRGVAVAADYPFDSADSTSLAQNAHRYSMPLFRGTGDEWGGLLAYADKLERRRA